MPEVTQAEFAAQLGVSAMAVSKAVKAGRITRTARGKIDPKKAAEQWERNTLPRPRASSKTPNSDNRSFAKERAVHERYRAAAAKLSYEEKRGKLVNRERVQIAEFNRSRIIRDGILNIPDRIAAQLAGESDARKVHEILTTELRNALNGIADKLDSLAG